MAQTLVFFGPPGCGKGTQAAQLKKALGIPHISTGDMFRDHQARGTELGKNVKEILARGELVPDLITNAMVRERMTRKDVLEGALLDGYPRNVSQSEELEAILGVNDRVLDGVIVIDVPAAELIQRLLKRGQDAGRADDQDQATIQKRLDTYNEQSEPCIRYYAETGVRVHKIDGVGSVEQVTQRILDSLKE